MKKNILRKVNEFNPAAGGRFAAHRDNEAQKNKNLPFDYYYDDFYALEEIRQNLMDLKSRYKDQNFQKAAVLVEKAQNAMLKAGR